MADLSDNQRSLLKRGYLISVFLLLCVSITLLVLDLFKRIDIEASPYFEIDHAITAVFWAEYLLRFFLVKKKREYFQENFIELISILPFSPEFGYLHLVRLLRFGKLMKSFHLPSRLKKSRIFRSFRRLKIRVSLFFNADHFLFGLECGILVLLISAFALGLVDSLPYFSALEETVLACSTFGLSAKNFGAVEIILIALPFLSFFLLLFWLFFAARRDHLRFCSIKKAVEKLFQGEII